MKRDLRMPLLVLALLFGAALALALRFGTPGHIVEPAIERNLPASVMDYAGLDVRYCHNSDCMAVVSRDPATDSNTCPRCGSILHAVSAAEQKILPPDTLILKKRYRNPAGREFSVSVVITGDQRASIHRPQWCLPAQGFAILSTEVIDIPLAEGPPLRAALLRIREEQDENDAGALRRPSLFAYWFVGRGMTTPYHWRRHLQAGLDSIFKGAVQRWAYISVSTACTYSGDADVKRLKLFISKLDELIRTRQE